MEQFANPEFFGNLSFGEKMAGTGITALMGMGITFAILIILWVMIAFMTKIIRGFENTGKKKAEAPAAAPAAPAAAAPAAAAAAPAAGGASPLAESASDDQLIAVIAAAIAAAEGGAAAPSFVVKKIQRLAGPATAWNMA
ncbi:MAG: OadG family protein, partial [Clostridiales bacterium]|nr:OadG family protein [Clostridiales bacterium]